MFGKKPLVNIDKIKLYVCVMNNTKGKYIDIITHMVKALVILVSWL